MDSPSPVSGGAFQDRASSAVRPTLNNHDSRSPIQRPECLRRVAVVDVAGSHLRWADEHDARTLLHTRQGAGLYTRRGRLKAIQVVDFATLVANGSGPRKQRYSHNRETATNPHGCWTLTHISADDRQFYGLEGLAA